MAGTKALRKIQLGREATSGTAVPATTVLRAMGVINDSHETVFVEEDVGILGGVDRTNVGKKLAGLTVESSPATFEQFVHFLESGIMTATPAADGVGSGKIYTYTFPTTTLPTIKTYTGEAGDNQQAEEVEYLFTESFTLEGVAGEALMMSAEMVGRQVTKTTYTGALSVPTVEDILFSLGKLYIDTAGGSYGTTQVTNTLIQATLEYTTGIIPKYTADGNLYFSFIQNVMPEIILDVTMEHNAAAVAEKDAWIAQTPRLLRLKFEGSNLQTAGTSYSKKTLIIDLAGKWEAFESLGEQDGNDILTGTFRSRYNSTVGNQGKIVVVNELTAIP